ncbi:alkene reductase [Methylorubrum extorquens]|uniref:12-oxophytodienoate reductase n=1 Tax=Methylorubrum extorquens DSM 13060 TaxID=882800 RepID=H1KLF4_METEX|nr:alkene reductase [Methylorubrum extorquens]EHP91639.1 12-oxophytodienoate reductase [Methylorubrum extorquens DSM 13060]
MEDTATLSRKRGPAQSSDTDALFQPYRLGPLDLPHRIVMAPLTRSRARLPGNVPNALMACYYAQRASAALIVGEATQISMQGQGYAWTPGIHSSEQAEAWRRVTRAVHESGGRIFCQLWHVGRISHPALQPDNMLPVAPSAIIPQGKAFIENERGEGALVPFVRPRALTLEEMPYIVAQYERAARNAQSADFDGIEIHAANGYLLDQFIESSTNRRSDTYGGSVENRTRLLLEVAEALSRIWGPDRIGVRISPLGKMNEISDNDPEATFGYLVERLAEFGFAYLHLVNPATAQMQKGGPPDQRSLALVKLIRERFKGALIAAGGFDAEAAAQWIREGRADLIAFGRKFIANPDLPERLRAGAPLNADDPTTYYGGGEKGYTDYPCLAQERGEQPGACVDQSWR